MIEKKEQEASLKFKTNPYPGLFICLEGIDACGKDTQGEKITELLRSQGKDVILTEEPNKAFFKGEEIRAVLEHRYSGEIPSPLEFQKWYVANRQHHLEERVIDSLKNEQIVVTLRYFWSTIAYGSLGRVQKNTLIKLNQEKGFFAPDLTIFLDISAEEALKRKNLSGKELEFFEKKEKLEKVSQSYKDLVLNFGGQITTVNGEQPKTEITDQIMNLIKRNRKFENSKTIE